MRTARDLAIVTLMLLAAGSRSAAAAGEAANKELVRSFTTATNAADWDALAEIVAEDFVRHSAATQGPAVNSRQAFIELQRGFLKSFPDQHVTLHRVIAEGDYVAVLATYSGTQLGPLGDMPATGRFLESPFLAMFRIDAGRIAELWVEWDNLAMLGQLGLLPTPPGASPSE